MKNPDNLHDALNHLHYLLGAVAKDLENYLEDPVAYDHEYFEDIKNAALDAHLLVTWIKDNLSYPPQ
jgi:hypothetical protein